MENPCHVYNSLSNNLWRRPVNRNADRPPRVSAKIACKLIISSENLPSPAGSPPLIAVITRAISLPELSTFNAPSVDVYDASFPPPRRAAYEDDVPCGKGKAVEVVHAWPHFSRAQTDLWRFVLSWSRWAARRLAAAYFAECRNPVPCALS